MMDIRAQPATEAPVEGSSQVDSEAIIEKIWDDLGGTTSRSEIRKALIDVAPLYEGVRVNTFVPIFIRRDVLRRLRDGMADFQGPMAPKPENAAPGKMVDSTGEGTVEPVSKNSLPDLMQAPGR